MSIVSKRVRSHFSKSLVYKLERLYEDEELIAAELRDRFLELGFFIRPLGNTLYLMPPYCISDRELESIYQDIRKVLDT